MVKYVVGLMFDDSMNRLVLIHKRHGPECVIGKWNGVGGHIEEGEQPTQTMVREFEEETGVLHTDWHKFCVLKHPQSECEVHFFYAKSTDAVQRVKTLTDEVVSIFRLAYSGVEMTVLPLDIMQNLTWMVPFVRDTTIPHDLGTIETVL